MFEKLGINMDKQWDKLFASACLEVGQRLCSYTLDLYLKVLKMGVNPKIGFFYPQNGWFIMQNLIKMDDLGGPPLFLETPRCSFISKSFSTRIWYKLLNCQLAQELQRICRYIQDTWRNIHPRYSDTHVISSKKCIKYYWYRHECITFPVSFH